MFRIWMVILTSMILAACAAPEEMTAEERYHQALRRLAAEAEEQSRQIQSTTLTDWADWLTDAISDPLCNAIEPYLSEDGNEGRQQQMLIAGGIANLNMLHALGWAEAREYVFDLYNFQAAAGGIVTEEYNSKLAETSARFYGGVAYGPYRSGVLSMMGERSEWRLGANIGVPGTNLIGKLPFVGSIISRLLPRGFASYDTFEVGEGAVTRVSGGTFNLGVGFKIDNRLLSFIPVIGQIDIRRASGNWYPLNEETAELKESLETADSSLDLEVRDLRSQCPNLSRSAEYIDFFGGDPDAATASFTDRTEKMIKAMMKYLPGMSAFTEGPIMTGALAMASLRDAGGASSSMGCDAPPLDVPPPIRCPAGDPLDGYPFDDDDGDDDDDQDADDDDQDFDTEDTTPPTVLIVGLPEIVYESGSDQPRVRVNVQLEDDESLTRVELLRVSSGYGAGETLVEEDAESLGRALVADGDAVEMTAPVEAGDYTLTVKVVAYDEAGNEGVSAPRTVEVSADGSSTAVDGQTDTGDSASLEVSFVNPEPVTTGAPVVPLEGLVVVLQVANGGGGLQGVTLSAGDLSLGEKAQGPFTFEADFAAEQDGKVVTLRAVATDTAGGESVATMDVIPSSSVDDYSASDSAASAPAGSGATADLTPPPPADPSSAYSGGHISGACAIAVDRSAAGQVGGALPLLLGLLGLFIVRRRR